MPNKLDPIKERAVTLENARVTQIKIKKLN